MVKREAVSFWRWWTSELKDLAPARIIARSGRSARRLVLSIESGQTRLLLEKGRHVETLGQIEGSGRDRLEEITGIARTLPRLPLGIRFAAEVCFAREVELPALAEAEFDRLLELDLERTTPFRTGEVLTAYFIDVEAKPARRNRIVRHLVMKRETLGPVLAELRALGIEPAFVDCWREDGLEALPVNFLAANGDAGRTRNGLMRASVCVAAALTLSAAAIPILQHRGALHQLDTRIAAGRSEAEVVRRATQSADHHAAQLAALDKLVGERISMAGIVEELTKRIPDGAWLSELRIDGNVLDVTGFAASAVSLVPHLEKSGMFSAVNLTSPVIFDAEENTERFSLRLQLSGVRLFPGEPTQSAISVRGAL